MSTSSDGLEVKTANSTYKLPRQNGGWREFACGWGAAVINVGCTYPINKMIFRQMLHGINIYNAFLEIKSEGMYFLYRGMLPPLCQKTFSMSIMFGVYEEVKGPLIDNGMNKYAAKATAAMISGTSEAILMPFERIQTLLSDSGYHNHFRNTYHAFKVVGNQYGFKEYYRGLTPILLRNGPSNVGFFIIREEFQARMPVFDSELKRTLAEFMCGASIGLLLSTVFYPLNVVKIAMQSKIGGDFENFWKVLIQIYHERGGTIRGIYKGIHTNCSRAIISWGVMNTAYEHLKTFICN